MTSIKKQIMKYLSVILLLLVLILSSYNLNAQDTDDVKYSIQIDYGISNTLHYNQPVIVTFCEEGCYPEVQKPRIASNMDLSIYRAYNKNNSLKIGVGFSEYRFFEKGLASPGDASLLPYESIIELQYFSFNAGFRHIFNSNNNIFPFVATELIYEVLPGDKIIMKNYGLASKSKIGAIIRISDKWSTAVECFYKTGIVNYREKKFDKNYIPFGYGIQVGIEMKI